MRTSRLDAFAVAINFFELPPPAPHGRGLVPSWPSVNPADILGDGWVLTTELIYSELRGGVKDLFYSRGEEVVTLTIFVSGEGEAAAREWFLARASATSAPEIPFRRSQLSLGQLAVETDGPMIRELLWLLHNLVFFLRAINTGIDLEEVAHRVQQNTVTSGEIHDLAASSPKVAPVAPATGTVGQLLRIPILLKPPSELLQHYEVAVRTKGNAIDFISIEGNYALFELQKAGIDSFTIDVIDRQTMLNRRIEAEVEVKSPQV